MKNLQNTRNWYVNNKLSCIHEAISEKAYINPEFGLDNYVKQCADQIKKIKNGDFDHTLAFQQKLHYLNTGESVAILQK